MTHEQKIKEYCERKYRKEGGFATRETVAQAMTFIAKWKDKQLKQILDERIEHSTGERHEAFMNLYRQLFEQNAISDSFEYTHKTQPTPTNASKTQLLV